MIKELLLEKYVASPLSVTLSDSNMLEANGIIINNNVTNFDAVTDVSGAIHGVYLTADSMLQYFRMQSGLPITKTIAKDLPRNTSACFSISEEAGILHILVCRNENTFNMHHYRTKNNSWIKSTVLNAEAGSELVDICPLGDGGFAILLRNGKKYKLYIISGNKHEEIKIPIEEELSDISMTQSDNDIEFIFCDSQENIKCIKLSDIRASNRSDNFKEAKMANGSIINSKYIALAEQNQKEINSLKSSLEALTAQIESLKATSEPTGNQIKYLTMSREQIRQHDNQINQLSIRIQELNNRVNALSKRK